MSPVSHALRVRIPLRLATGAGRLAARTSRRLGIGAGSVIAGRVALGLRPDVLSALAAGRRTVVVTGTNGKTTTTHLVVAALGGPDGLGPIAHNAAGSNMTDGAVSALLAAPTARLAALEVDELHLGEILRAVRPAVVVVLNLSRDQLDRVSEVRAVAETVHRTVTAHPGTVVVANADDPMVVWTVGAARERVVWVAAGGGWDGDTRVCPACGALLDRPHDGPWSCSGCGLRRPDPAWWWQETVDGATVGHRFVPPVALPLHLPGRANLGNAVMALAAADSLGTPMDRAAPRLGALRDVAGRYGVVVHHGRRVRVLLVKNPAGWREAVDVLVPGRPVVVAINAREADGRDVSWLWDLETGPLAGRLVVAAGDRAADLGVRLGYAEIAHDTEPDPLVALDRLPDGDVDVLATYTAFTDLRARLTAPAASRELVGAGRGR
ncbi:MurT ligase domain-containing protein [Actinomycetospora sp. CA-053990]|uniref:MurT ligase domain-containing protein n=1 Tax=Actinomycetospora sp. CA-053990 TaxID=3239891 RepID=UPI003D95000A